MLGLPGSGNSGAGATANTAVEIARKSESRTQGKLRRCCGPIIDKSCGLTRAWIIATCRVHGSESILSPPIGRIKEKLPAARGFGLSDTLRNGELRPN